MTPEPYTPATVRRIRECAQAWPDAVLARELGWPLSQLHSVARRHQIALTRGAAMPEAEPATPPARPETPGKRAIEAAPVHPDGIEWYRGSGRLARCKAETVLTSAQSAVFDLLLARMRADPAALTTETNLPAAMVGDYKSFSHFKPKINGKIEPLGLQIASFQHAGGGFRLVDLLAARAMAEAAE